MSKGNAILRIEYDDDVSSIMRKVNEALAQADTGLAFRDDNLAHDGYVHYMLVRQVQPSALPAPQTRTEVTRPAPAPTQHLMRKFVANMRGDGVRTEWVFEHGLGTLDLVPNVRTSGRGSQVSRLSGAVHGLCAHVSSPGPNHVRVRFNGAPDDGEEMLLVLVG